MFRMYCLLGLLTLPVLAGLAAPGLSVVRASSKSVTIRDGSTLKARFWHLDPSISPDTYFVDFPRASRRVSFITDQDSISVDTRYGQDYEFIILVNGRDSCRTRIAARYQGAVLPQQINPRARPDTIPFVLRDSRPYLLGTVNGHKAIAIMLDLGAGVSCVNIHSVAKTGMRFTEKMTITNTNGTQQEPSSANTTLELGNLRWRNVPVVQVRNLADEDDMIVGNALFRDQILELDYDRKLLIVHPQSVAVPAGYTRHAVQLDQHRPKIQVELSLAGRRYTDWFLFDTGRDGTMLIGDDFTGEFDVWNKFKTLLSLGNKKIVVVPAVKVGRLTFTDIVTNAADPAHPNGKQSLLGNELLNQFNLVLDNRQGMLYLKPNSLQGGAYEQWGSLKPKVYGAGLGAMLLLGGLVWLLVRRFSRAKRPVPTKRVV